MTAPVWMASPPEVWSTLLSSGPGPGSLQVAAAQWHTLSVQYAEVAHELTALLGEVEAAAWQGPSAVRYGAAHLPYLAWLTQASADSAAAAAGHEAAVVAYTAALAAMPTMPELIANHALHATLVATNFFGVNTIPIAVNEADYLRMWVQAAVTMTGYQTASTAALTAAPQTPPAPMIMTAETGDMPGGKDGMEHGGGTGMPGAGDNGGKPPMWWMMGDHVPQTPEDWYHALFPPQFNPFDPKSFGMMYPSLEKFLPRIGEMFSAYSGNPAQLAQAMFFLGAQFIVHRTLFLSWIVLNNPAMLGTFIAANPVYSVGLVAGAAAPVAAAPVAASGLSGLAGLAGVPAPTAPAVAPAAPMPSPPTTPPAPITPQAAAAPTPPAAGPGAPVAPAAPPAAGGPPPAPVLGPEAAIGAQNAVYPYLATAVTAGSETRARRRTPSRQADPAAAPAPAAVAAAEQEKQRRARRKKTDMLGRGYEYMDLEPDVEDVEPIAASAHGAGPLGFAGTATAAAAPRAGGLADLAADPRHDGPRTPMMPGTWRPGSSPENPGR